MREQRHRRRDGAQTAETILREAADLASREGLDRLTIGTLAERLGMSKSGLFAHFGSKEELQLATIAAAADRVTATVLRPAFKATHGIERLVAVCERLIDYLARPEFPGGCFFNMTRAEFHARPGVVRDAIADSKRYWRQLLVDLAIEARAQGELAADIDPEQLAFELEAVMDAATWSVADERKEREIRHARRAVRRILAQAQTRPDASDDRSSSAARSKPTVSRRPNRSLPRR
jgi:AcrR family transcriptional regulator